ncbi:MAG: germination protein YpeB [Clostridia bacterium]|nr:germination protein YpeB [Clostridia bacterium]
MTVRRRKFIRIISYLIALCVVFAVSGVFTARAKSDYESTLERVRLEGLVSLTEYSREISTGLRLLAVSAGDSLADSSSYVSARAVGAMGCLGCFNSEKVDNLTRFFSGVYDFSEGFSGSEDSRKAAIILSDYAQEIYYHLSDLTNAVMSGEYTLTEYYSIYGKSKVPYFEDELDFYNGNENGIFSIITPVSSASERCAYLREKNNVSADEAKQTAGRAAEILPALWREGEMNENGVDLYVFTCGDTEVDICKAGGILYRLINPQPCGAVVYTADDARKKAVEFMKIHDFKNTVELCAEQEEFTARFVFLPEINGVLLLMAKIDIEICLASGKVIYFDASEYVKRYRTDISAPGEMPEISAVMPYGLIPKNTFVCVADIEGREKLCILAVCPFEQNKVYIFFDYYSLKIKKTVTA